MQNEDWDKLETKKKLPDNVGNLNEMRDAYFNGTPPSVISNAIFANEPVPADYVHPMSLFRKGEELTEGVMFFAFFGNVTAISTQEGIVMVDAGGFGSKVILNQLRIWRPNTPIHTVIYTHGHMDHVLGMRTYDREQPEKIRVIAHKNVGNRFKRYVKFNGYNKHINGRQFITSDPKWPTKWREADEVYDGEKELFVGGEKIILKHDKGETDDSTWVWLPRQRVLVTGDLFIWAFPNCGNPQKVQRYPIEWMEALKKMKNLSPPPLFLLPGHGPPILGEENIKRALGETIEGLELIINHTIEGINNGKRLQEIVDSLSLPSRLLDRPYLRPIYDEPQFVVRNLWRLFAGWWDGEATHLKPVEGRIVAKEIATLAGGANVLCQRALTLLQQNQTPLSSHLIEIAHNAEPENEEITTAYKKIYAQRSEESESVMARGIYKYFADNPPLSKL